MSLASSKDLEIVRALIAKAAHEGTPHHEAAAAALQAAKRIHKFDLLSLEAVRLARADAEVERAYADEERARADAAAAAGRRLVRLEVLLLVMSETAKAYRFARLCPDYKSKGMPVIGWILKKYVHHVEWASAETAKRYSGAGRRVVEAIIVPQDCENQVRAVVTGARA